MDTASPLAALIAFWILVLFTAGSALLVAVARKIIHAAFALCLCFLGVAGIYVFLHADFLAAVQLIVYVGGILVLILFGVMFSSHAQDDQGETARSPWALGAGALTSIAVFVAVVLMIRRLAPAFETPLTQFAEAPYRWTLDGPSGSKVLGHLLMGEYLLPFELASVLILAALIGAVVIVRKETRTVDEDPEEEEETLEEPDEDDGHGGHDAHGHDEHAVGGHDVHGASSDHGHPADTHGGHAPAAVHHEAAGH